jgi:succinoglycan biosynthesis transport protein ExoP
MNDDSDKDKKKQSLLSHSTPGPGTAARGGGSLLSAASGPEDDDPVARHRAARSRREAAPSPLLSALAAMEGFKTEPAAPAATADKAGIKAEPSEEEQAPSWWDLRNLLSPKVKHDRPESAPAAKARQPIPTAPAPTVADKVRADEPANEEPAEEVATHHRASKPEFSDDALGLASGDIGPRSRRSAPDDQRWQPLVDPLTVMGGIGRSKTLIVTATVLGALIGAAVALSTPKKYESTVKLIVDPRDLKVSDRNLTETGLPSDATLALIENQVVVLTSGKVLNKVVGDLDLQDDPEFNGQSQGFGIGDVVAGLRALISGGQSGEGGDRRRALAVSNLAEALSVEREGKTFVVNLTATTEDPERSALIANTVKDVFLETTGKLQSETARRAADEFDSRLDQLRADLDEAERKSEKFRAEHDLIDAQGRLISDDELVKLNEQLSIARAHTIELNARSASAQAIRVDSVIGGGLPEALSSPVMSELRSQYSAMKQQADQLSVQLGPRHPQHLAMQAQLEGARSQISVELQRIVASVEMERKRAIQQEQDLAARLAQLKVRATDVNSDLVTMREFEREAAAKRAVYENFLLRAREAGGQRDMNTANITVISDAYPPLESTGPSRAAIAAGGAILGFIVGIGLGMLRGIMASVRESGAARRRPRPATARSAHASADAPVSDTPLSDAPAAEAPAGAPPFEPAAEEPDTKPREATANPFIRLMDRFRSPPIVTGDSGPAARGPAPDPAVNAPVETPANQEPEPMHNYPQQPSAFPGQPQPQQPHYGQQPQPYPHAVPYPPQAIQHAPYMPQQPLPPYPPAFVQPHPHAPHVAPQPYAYAYPPAPQPQPAYPGWQPQPGMAYGYPQPAAPAYPAYAPMPPQPPAYPQEFRPMSQPAPASREMSPLEEVRESLREFREAIRDLAEDRARRRVS